MKYSCVDQVLPSPFQKEQEIMKSPNPSQMAGRREGWRTSARLAWSVAARLLSADDLSFAVRVLSEPPTRHLRVSGLTPNMLIGSFSGSVILTAGVIFRNMNWYRWVYLIHADFGKQRGICALIPDRSVAITENSFFILCSRGFPWHLYQSYKSFMTRLNKLTVFNINEHPVIFLHPFIFRCHWKPAVANTESCSYSNSSVFFPLCSKQQKEHNCWSRPPAQETVNVQLSMSP